MSSNQTINQPTKQKEVSTKKFGSRAKVAGMLASGILLAGVAGGFAVQTFAANNPTDTSSIQTAIANKDLAAFKQAIVDTATQKANDTTQADFDKITSNYDKQQAVEKAITDNNYDEFKAAADSRMLERVNSQAEFDNLVSQRKAEADRQAKILTAVQNNDLDSFKTIMKDTSNLPTPPTDANGQTRTRPAPTDVQLQTEFDKLVTYYKANGKLPDRGFGLGGGGHRGGPGGEMGGMMNKDATVPTDDQTTPTDAMGV